MKARANVQHSKTAWLRESFAAVIRRGSIAIQSSKLIAIGALCVITTKKDKTLSNVMGMSKLDRAKRKGKPMSQVMCAYGNCDKWLVSGNTWKVTVTVSCRGHTYNRNAFCSYEHAIAWMQKQMVNAEQRIEREST